MKILALDSSGLVAGVALVEDDTLVAEYSTNYKKTHSQTLLPMLDALREMVELDLHSIDVIAVAAGPGSFTGLRIGSATAKGLGLALGIPIAPVPTVDALAMNLYGSDKLICPVMDARRSQVYTGLYTFEKENGTYVLCEKLAQCALTVEQLAEKINACGREVIFLGDGVGAYRNLLEGLLRTPYSFAAANGNCQRAASVAVLGAAYAKAGRLVKAADFVPRYLRAPQAERERMQAGEEERERMKAGICAAKNDVLHIRPMEIKDAAIVAAMEAASTPEAWTKQAYEEALANQDACYLVAEWQGAVVGCCGFWQSFEDADICNVAVREGHRKKGIAQRMLAVLMEEAKGRGVLHFTLEVRSGNMAAVRLYEKLGFVTEGIRKGFYEKPREDALIMWKR